MISSLEEFEQYLVARLHHIKRTLPKDGTTHENWQEFFYGLDIATRIRAQLYPACGGTGYAPPRPPRRRVA